MTDVDRIYESALADEWEEQNRPESESFPKWKDAIAKLTLAKTAILAAAGLIAEASEMVEGSTFEDRIASFVQAFDGHVEAIAHIAERMKRN